MKKLYIMFGILPVLLVTPKIFAQEASVIWVLNNTTQLTSVNVGNLTGSAESISSGSGQFGMSVFDYSNDGQRLWEGTAGWIAGAEEATRFIQFDALPVSGNSFIVTNVSFNYGAAGIDHNIQSNAYYSTDGWITRTLLNQVPLEYPGSGMSTFTQDVSVTIESSSTFSLRIYPYAIVNSSPMRPIFAVHNSVGIRGTSVAKKNCVIQITDLACKWGKSVELKAKLLQTAAAGNTNLPNKEIKFYMDSVFVKSCLTNASGEGSVLYDIPAKTITRNWIADDTSSTIAVIKVEFAGDVNYNAQSDSSTLTIEKHVTSLAVANVNGNVGQTITLGATLLDNDESGKGVSDQELKFYKISPGTREGDTVDMKTATYIGSDSTDANGAASIAYTIPQDSVSSSILVLFAGDVNYGKQSGAGTFTLTTNPKSNCVIQITDLASKWGKSVELTAKLLQTAAAGNTNLPNKEIKFYMDSVFVKSCITNASGDGSVLYDIPAKTITRNWIADDTSSTIAVIKVEFAGDVNYNAQSDSSTLTIEKHITSLVVANVSGSVGQTVVLEATLFDNDVSGKGVSNQELKFYKISPGTREGDTARVYIGSDTTDTNGAASISIDIKDYLVETTQLIMVEFLGDANYNAQSDSGKLTITLVGIENSQMDIPTKFALTQNYPNPFNPTSTIRYDIPKTSFVKISVYDILGREIKVLMDEEKNPGHYEIIFNASNLASGIYYYTIKAGNFTQSKKMILLK